MPENTKPIKLHGMSSEKASRVKKRGHKKEFLYANLIKGIPIKGTNKQDVIDCNSKYHSVKGGGEMKGGEGRKGKWQIFLYKKSKFDEDLQFCGREIFIKILNTYPSEYNDYQITKTTVKENIKPYMIELKIFLDKKQNKRNFLNKTIFDRRVNYFVIFHDDEFYVYDREETINTFTNSLDVDNSSSFQKVVFKHGGNIVAEIEVRTTDDGKYPSILFNMLKLKAFDILNASISPSKSVKPNLHVYGKALDIDFWTPR